MAGVSHTINFQGHDNRGAEFGQVQNSTINNTFNNQHGGESENQDLRTFMHGLVSDYRQWKDNNPRRAEGTCQWLLNDPRFIQWRDESSPSLLHILAGPGCGKSVLARALIDERLAVSSTDTKILYFFFKRGNESQEKPTTAVTAMLHQLYTLPMGEALLERYAMPTYRSHGLPLVKMFNELWDIFTTSTSGAGMSIVCVIDALDECDESDREKFMNAIMDHIQNAARDPSKIGMKFVMTGRPYSDSDFEILDQQLEFQHFVRFDGAHKSDEIAEEINRVIAVKVPRTIPKVSSEMQQLVIKQLQSMENRTYLWLHLILDYMKKRITFRGTPDKIRLLISELPPTLDRAYQEMLERSTDPEMATALLSIILAARRPLTLSEACIALELTQSRAENCQSIADIETETDDSMIATLADLCGLILSVHQSRIYFIHETAREFLLSKQSSTSNDLFSWKGSITTHAASLVMGRSCILFFGLTNFDGVSHFDANPFLDYAVKNWLLHFLPNEDSLFPELKEKAWKLCEEGSAAYKYCMEECLEECLESAHLPRSGFEIHFLSSSSSLEHFSALGSKTIVRHLLDLGEVARIRLAFVIASKLNHTEVVRLFLDYGVDVNSKGYSGSPPLSFISYEDPALHYAARAGAEETARVLLKAGADFDMRNRYGDTALHCASRSGFLRIVKLLLERGADINTQGENEQTALHDASRKGHLRIVELLLESRADIQIQDIYGKTALHHASQHGDLRIVEVLLERGVNIDNQNTFGETALHHASQHGDLRIVELLLERGVDIDIQNIFGESALHHALVAGQTQVAELLLKQGADIGSMDVEGKRALYFHARRNGTERINSLLLE